MNVRRLLILLSLLLLSFQLFPVVISGFKVEGNVTLSDEEIASMTGFKIGEEVYQLDLQIAAKRLFNSGYFSDVNLNVAEKATGNVLLINVAENPVLKDYIVEVNGPELVSKDSLEAAITLERGKALSVTQLQKSLQNIQKLYQEAGYFLIEVKSNVSVSPSGIVNIPDGELVITINEYSIWDVAFEPRLPQVEMKYLRSKLAIPLYKSYASKPALLRLFLSKKDYYPTLSQFQQTQSNLADVAYIGPQTRLAFEPSNQASNALVMKVEISPPKITEGTVQVERVEFSGNETVAKETLEKAASEALLELGEKSYSSLEIGIVVDRARRVYEKAGVLFVDLHPEVKGRTLKVHVEERKLSKVVLEGLTKTKPYLVEDHLRVLKEGQVVKLSELATAYRSLNATGYFEAVNVIPREAATGVELVVEFTETSKPRKFGGGITWTDPKEGTGFWDKLWKGLSGYLDFQIVNTFGYGESLSTMLELGTTKRNVKLGGSLPRVGGSYFDLGSEVYYTEGTKSATSISDDPDASETTVSTTTRVLGVKPNLSYRLNTKDFVGLSLTLERGEEISATETRPKNSTQLGVFFQHRDVNDLWYPTNGNWINLRYTLSGFVPSDTFGFQKLFLDTRVYWQLVPELSLALRGQIGTMWNMRGAPELFSLGGSTTIRGTTDTLIGPCMWLVNAELRWKLLESDQAIQLYGVGFADVGYAGEDFEGVPRASVGAGLHLKVPGLGVFRLDWPYVDSRWKTSFGFGAMF